MPLDPFALDDNFLPAPEHIRENKDVVVILSMGYLLERHDPQALKLLVEAVGRLIAQSGATIEWAKTAISEHNDQGSKSTRGKMANR